MSGSKMAHYDALTGLPNRTLFYERLSQEIARTRRTSASGGGLLALMLLDLDRFKMINDTLGHDVGDLLLQETAGRLKESVREYDVVARLAGDEFTVILPEVVSVRDATDVATRIIDSINRPFRLDGNELMITTSVGICFHPADGHDPATLVKNADAAMYRAKASGKNRYEVFAEDVLQNPTKHFEIENEINRAIEENQFILYYQPQVQISTSRMVGVEALIRWEHPERGLVYPKDFLPVAEETGLIFAMERWVLREACRQMRSWQERYPTDKPLTTSVNLSSRHFMHPNLAGVVHRVLEETGLHPECLILEVKESILNEDVISANVTLQALKNLGVGLAVDNFGAGSSSLSKLKRFPLEVLKIDASFIRALHEREEDREVASAVISLAHALGLKVIAECVENPRQLMQLREMGCDTAQGNYFAESLSPRATSAFLVADLYY
ncbi:MAG: bifunctional diguanylate cyclase/phosphodiesterase [Actinomycetota bacterium]|nr:bifunctional diguanylate cyclase/phosphodiesterase [Actinomycetota bacterium]